MFIQLFSFHYGHCMTDSEFLKYVGFFLSHLVLLWMSRCAYVQLLLGLIAQFLVRQLRSQLTAFHCPGTHDHTADRRLQQTANKNPQTTMKMNGLTRKENVRQFFILCSNYYSLSFLLISQETQERKAGSFQLTWPWEKWSWARTSS